MISCVKGRGRRGWPYVWHVPALTGAAGGVAVRRFYSTQFIGQTPGDAVLRPIARTISTDRVIDEFVLEFTHDREIPFMLPGVAPTGRKVRIPTVVVMGFRDRKVAYEHIYWDQALGARADWSARLRRPSGRWLRAGRALTRPRREGGCSGLSRDHPVSRPQGCGLLSGGP